MKRREYLNRQEKAFLPYISFEKGYTKKCASDNLEK